MIQKNNENNNRSRNSLIKDYRGDEDQGLNKNTIQYIHRTSKNEIDESLQNTSLLKSQRLNSNHNNNDSINTSRANRLLRLVKENPIIQERFRRETFL